MAKIIKVRCNGAGKHVNEVDVDQYTQPTVVVRGSEPKRDLPERLVIPCQHCTDGEIIVTREMIERTLK